MPLLDILQLALLRIEQEKDATTDRRCPNCAAQIWQNYCREHDEYYIAGHYETCVNASRHQNCKRIY